MLNVSKRLLRQRWDIYLYALSVVLFSLNLAWHLQFFFLAFSALLGWLFFRKWKKAASAHKINLPTWLAIIPFAVLIFTRVILYIKYSDFPQLGYDMGIYKYEFQQAGSLKQAIHTSFYPGLIILVSLLQKIGLSVDFFMREFYILLNLLIGVMVYLTAKEFFGKKTAFVALLFYVGSITQFTAYYFFLYKNVLALSLLLGTFILLHRRSYWAIPAGLYLGIVQPPDFLILAFAMMAIFIYRFKNRVERTYLLKTGGVIAALFLSAFLFRFEQIAEGVRLILTHGQHWDPSISGGGVFIGFSIYIEQAIYYLPFLLIGLLVGVLRKHPDRARLNYIHFAFLASAAIVLFKLIFYKRYIIELDLFAVMFAALGAVYLLQRYWQKIWQKILWALFGVAILWVIASESWYSAPLLYYLEAARIMTLCQHVPENALVMATDNFYSPWLRGYSCHETIAPGLFELNPWNEEGWREFWSGDKELIEKRMQSLAVHHKPIYLFVGLMQPKMDFTDMQGFSKMRSYLWRWDFQR